MSAHMIVKPSRPGMGLRDPKTRQMIPDEGGVVEESAFWRTAIMCGHAVELKAAAGAKADAKKADAKKAEAKKAAAGAKADAKKADAKKGR